MGSDDDGLFDAAELDRRVDDRRRVEGHPQVAAHDRPERVSCPPPHTHRRLVGEPIANPLQRAPSVARLLGEDGGLTGRSERGVVVLEVGLENLRALEAPTLTASDAPAATRRRAG